jgi:hypothetical protein
MLFDLAENQYRLHFKHYQTVRTYDVDAAKWICGYTTASIARRVNGGWQFQAGGTTRCSASDQFNKEVGRKLALRRALTGWGREARRTVWQAYWRERGVERG